MDRMRGAIMDEEYVVFPSCNFCTFYKDETCDNPESDGYGLETMKSDYCSEFKSRTTIENE